MVRSFGYGCMVDFFSFMWLEAVVVWLIFCGYGCMDCFPCSSMYGCFVTWLEVLVAIVWLISLIYVWLFF